MRTSIVAREAEIRQLDSLLEEELPQFVAVYGRRRVGKTFLIKDSKIQNSKFKDSKFKI